MGRDLRPVFLVGFMGSGKTVVAREVATLLDWQALDTDELVERREGRSIDAIFSERGEGYFRRVEQEVLEGLEGRERCVVSTGGGLFLGTAQRGWIRRCGRSVWLDCPLEICTGRVGGGVGRPLWIPQDPATFRTFFDKRRAAYALADLRIDAASGTPTELARRILGRLGLAPQGRK